MSLYHSFGKTSIDIPYNFDIKNSRFQTNRTLFVQREQKQENIIPSMKDAGVQYHPEFKSRPNKPHPLFKGFIGAAFELSKNNR